MADGEIKRLQRLFDGDLDDGEIERLQRLIDVTGDGTPELVRRALREIFRHRAAAPPAKRAHVEPGYEQLAAVLDDALRQAQSGKGRDRHSSGEPFHDQQIVQLGEWMGGSTVFAIGQACKKALASTRLDDPRARSELFGAINYLAAAVIVIDRRNKDK